MDTIATNLRDALDAAGMTRDELGRRASIRPIDVEQFLDGRARPCPRQQARLAHALGITLYDLHREL